MYTDVHFQNGHGCPGCQSAASFSLEKLVVEPCPRRYVFRTATDGGGVSQQWVCGTQTHVQALTRMSIQKRTRMSGVLISSKFFVRKTCRWAVYTEVHGSTAAQDRSGIRYQALYVHIQRLIASLTKRQTRCWVEPRPSMDDCNAAAFDVRRSAAGFLQKQEKDTSG